jgi:hypothetical protein
MGHPLQGFSGHEYVVSEPKGAVMDKLKKLGDSFGGGGLEDQLKDIQFPASKDEVVRQLEQKGVPGPVVDKIRDVDTSQFDSVDEVVAKVKSFMLGTPTSVCG